MNKLNVGDYVRTRDGDIGKTIEKYKGVSGSTIYKIDRETEDFDYTNVFDWEIKNSSPNIIDLIEVGDYVDKLRVVDTYEYYIVVEIFDERIVIQKEDTIKSVVTKEHFENISYKVGE